MRSPRIVSVLSAAALTATAGLVSLAAPASAGVCGPGGWYDEVSSPSQIWYNMGPAWSDYNGTSSDETETITITATGSVSTTVAAGVHVSADFLIAESKADLNISGTLSVSVTATHTATITIPPGKTGNLQYVVWGDKVETRHYYETTGCTVTTDESGTSHVVTNPGTRSWLS